MVEDNLRKQVKEAQQNDQQASQSALEDLAKLKVECEREKEKREELEKSKSNTLFSELRHLIW